MKINVAEKIYFWLPIIFGCHKKPSRSFFIRNKQMPICARCTGELIGILLGIIIFNFTSLPNNITTILIMIPMLFDGFLQALTKYESNNFKRVTTGFLFGLSLYIWFLKYTFHAVNLAIELREKML